jgi:UDP-4-amino-4,6-dideoxy-N-acetyl-beta-L-altrosamine transaminase
MAEKSNFLPYGRQSMGEAEFAAARRVLGGDWLTTGPDVAAFETALADKMGSRYAVVCSSGTAALHLAMCAAGVEEGDRVVVPTLTFLATANAARYVGAEVAFSDVDPDNGLMRGLDLHAALGNGVKAVLPVHLAGQCADMAAIGPMAKERGAVVIEDASHAIGGRQRAADGKLVPVGSCPESDMAVFSFHPVKTITTAGEGGAITTNDETLFERLRDLRSHGMTHAPERWRNKDLGFDGNGKPNPWYYEMEELGFNYRLTDVQCAVGIEQLAKLAQFTDQRRFLVGRYDEVLAPLAPVLVPIRRLDTGEPAWHLYAVLIDFDATGKSRADVMAALAAEGIGSQVHYIPVHLQPYYQSRYGSLDLPGARAYYDRTLSLPLFPDMAVIDVDRVGATLRRVLGI